MKFEIIIIIIIVIAKWGKEAERRRKTKHCSNKAQPQARQKKYNTNNGNHRWNHCRQRHYRLHTHNA